MIEGTVIVVAVILIGLGLMAAFDTDDYGDSSGDWGSDDEDDNDDEPNSSWVD